MENREFHAIDVCLMDIEGTTTSLSFVKEVLFPYSRNKITAFLQENHHLPLIREALGEVEKTLREEGLSREQDPSRNLKELTDILVKWIDQDRKHTGLKTIQGPLWREGYEKKEYVGHVYEDVPLAFEKWKRKGIGLALYSSGSVEAQKLLFRHSQWGDLSPFFGHYFDTHVGAKNQMESYKKIGTILDCPHDRILFLSDVPAELDAAAGAGMKTCQLLRPGTDPKVPCSHPRVLDFSEISLQKK